MTFTSSTALGAGTLNVASRVAYTEAEGPGARYALWVQGCPLRCEGCCNPHMLDDQEASLMSVDDVVADILASEGIEGVTFIGGEPFWQAGALAEVARRVREAGLSVMVFTGYTLKKLQRGEREDWDAFLEQIDLLVDGPYIKHLHVDDRRWVGSSNQRTHFLTDRYAHMADDEAGWDASPNTIELRLVGGQLIINGFPHQSIVAMNEQIRKDRSEHEG